MCGGKVALPPIVKEKRRNSEKRKEKSRDAARCRRSKESEIFSDLCGELPLPSKVASALDKASVMRLTVGYLKIREMIKILFPKSEAASTTNVDNIYATVLNGFLLVLSEEGNVIYLSENVEEFIGISQVEMIGHSVFDFSHPCDHDEIKTLLASKLSGGEEKNVLDPETISIFLRMKSTIKTRGRTVNVKSATYQVIHYIGHKFDKPSTDNVSSRRPAFYLVFIGKTIPHPAHIEVPLDTDIFISRHSLDMKFTHVDERISNFLGFKSSELIGKSVYSLHHALDSSLLLTSFKTLFSKGQCETGYYRFLSKHGGYVWVVTQATLIYDNNTRPECVVCLNYVLSKIEHQNEIVCDQQEPPERKTPTHIPRLEEKETTTTQQERASRLRTLLSNTGVIFTLKETVMSKDFLNFPDTDILLFQEPLKDPKLQLELDLFQDDPCSIGNGICDDPFSYRDDSLSSPSYSGTPESSLHLSGSTSTSPDRFNTTPNTPDSGSLSDIPSLDPVDDFSNLHLKFTMPPSVSDKDAECYEEDLDFRAPFIPMQMDDDFPLISPSNSVMWGPQEHLPKKSPQERLSDPEPQRASPKQKSLNENCLKSSLAALLQSDVKKTPIATKSHERNTSSRRGDNKRWPNHHSTTVDNNNNHSRTASSKQRGFAPTRNYSSSGHIIMLDSLPIKKQPIKSTQTQRRNGGSSASSSERQSANSPFGSHTATVKVNDRLIKVQVSVSELPRSPIEQKQPFPSPPDPPPKRSSPLRLGPTESPKRLKVDGLNSSGSQGLAKDSVLLNLLVRGEDASRGYLCSSNKSYSENKFELPTVLSLPSSVDNSKSNSNRSPSSNCTDLLVSESELLDSFLKISQYDAEVPLQTTSHLLQGDDLLSAFDHPLLRNVAALV